MGYWLGIDMGTTFTAPDPLQAGRRALTEVIPLGTRFTAELGRPVAIDADPQSRDRARHRPLRTSRRHRRRGRLAGRASPGSGRVHLSFPGRLGADAGLARPVGQQGQLRLILLDDPDLGGRDPPRKRAGAEYPRSEPSVVQHTAPPSTPGGAPVPYGCRAS